MATFNLSSVTARAKLEPQREPYYIKIARGCHLGYRKMKADSQGTWVARFTESGTNKQSKQSFGSFEDRLPSERFEAAKAAAEDWFRHLGAGGTSEVVTVRSACQDYVNHIRLTKGESKANDIGDRLDRWVYPDEALASTELRKLRSVHLEEWRGRLMSTPVIENPHAEKALQRTRPRSEATLNRDMVPLRAALNYAHLHGKVSSDLAWVLALQAVEGTVEAGQRTLYLNRDERKKLLAHSSDEVRPFLTVLTMLPLRPGAVAKLTVGQFQDKLGVLSVGKDKSKGHRRLALPKHVVDFLSACTKDRLAADPLLRRDNGKLWTKDDWKVPLKAAAKAAELSPQTIVYTLRHSVITDLVVTGLDLLTVAQLSGTSVEMIEKTYGHLQASRSIDALETLAL